MKKINTYHFPEDGSGHGCQRRHVRLNSFGKIKTTVLIFNYTVRLRIVQNTEFVYHLIRSVSAIGGRGGIPPNNRKFCFLLLDDFENFS